MLTKVSFFIGVFMIDANIAYKGRVVDPGEIVLTTDNYDRYRNETNLPITLLGSTSHVVALSGLVNVDSTSDSPLLQGAQGGYEFTGGFADRTTGTAGASDVGTNVSYTTDFVTNRRWMRLGFDTSQQVTNDAAYWSDPAPAPTAGVGLFGGSYMPGGVTSLFDYGFNDSPGYSAAVNSGDFQYTAATGSYDFTQCQPGDLALIRFDFNLVPQIANTTVEVALIWQTRDANDVATFTFALTANTNFFGTGSVGKTFLQRPLISAYFASNEDVNARALPAIRADNPIEIQPLTTLVTIQR